MISADDYRIPTVITAGGHKCDSALSGLPVRILPFHPLFLLPLRFKFEIVEQAQSKNR
jgi:hypothetical protein